VSDPTEETGLTSRALQWIRQQPANGHLPLMRKLSSIFSTGPHICDDRLDIMVVGAGGMLYSVNIESDAWVEELSEKLKVKFQQLYQREVDPVNLRLFKAKFFQWKTAN
jgi:hypothetical protein